MDGIQMEPVGKYKTDRNGSAKGKAAWRNMVEQDLDDVAFLAESDKAAALRSAPVAVCSQRRALCLAALVLGSMFATALLIVYASPQPDCPCAEDSSLIPGQPPTDSDSAAAANKERIATNGAVFPWRGARLPTFVTPKHYSLWLHPNLTTGELRGEVSIDFRVDRDTLFVVLNVRSLNVTERALFKSGGSLGPKVARVLDYPQADQTYIEFKEKLRRKYNYTLSLRFITKLDRSDKQRGFFLTGNSKHRCAISRFWLTHARSAFPCLDEPHFRATFRLTIVRDRFHVSLTNMPIVATEEAGFYLGHRLLQDEFATSPPMPPHMVAMTVCRLQRRAAPRPTEAYPETTTAKTTTRKTTTARTTKASYVASSTETPEEEDLNTTPPEISLYSDQQVILDESGPLLEWVASAIESLALELHTGYPLHKLDLVVVEGPPWAEGWGLVALAPRTLADHAALARLLAMQWFGGLVSPRWWSSQWLMEALTSVLAEKVSPFGDEPERQHDSLLLDHILPALRLDSSNSVRAVASPRLEKADIESAADELALHKGAAIVSMAIEAAGEEAGRAALATLLKDHRFASADARDLWRALSISGSGNKTGPPLAWDGWCERPGYPLLTATIQGGDVTITQERFVMSANPPEPDPPMLNYLLTLDLRNELDEVFYEPENITEIYDENATTTQAPTTRRPLLRTTKAPPPPRWVIPLTFSVGPLIVGEETVKNDSGNHHNLTGTWYDVGNETRWGKSRWAENVTHLIWMNDTEMVIPDLGKHKWVRYNVGARGLYRVAPQDRQDGESAESAAKRAAELYESGGPAERALLLDDAFVLSRAGRLPASRAIAAIGGLRSEVQWAPWVVVVSHVSRWRRLLALGAAGPALRALLRGGHPPLTVYREGGAHGAPHADLVWLSGALLTAGVEWENENVTAQALELFDAWYEHNQTIPEIYQEGAFTAGVRRRGGAAWHAVWRALVRPPAAPGPAPGPAPDPAPASASAPAPGPRPRYRQAALLAALAAAPDDWLFYRFAYTVMSPEAQRNHEWKSWVTALCAGACKWRGPAATWRVLQQSPAPPAAALQAAANCLYQPADYHMFKKQFGDLRGAAAALDTIALNSAWVERADADLSAYFNAVGA